MPDPALEPGGPNLREAATLQGGDKVGHKNPPNREPTIPLAAVAPWNPAQTLERLGGDEKLLHEVMEIFREEAPKHLAGLREAISQQDAGTTERLAHTLHGELGYLGIPELLHGARELEEKGRTSDFQGASSLFPLFEAAVARLLASMGDAQKRGSENQLPWTLRREPMTNGAEPQSLGLEQPGPACNRVLIAEDDAMFRKILRSWLESWGYEVTVAEDGAKAWQILQEIRAPHLLILDWVMPNLNGIDLCRLVRERASSPYQYILLVTAKDDKQDLVRGLEAGADDYLSKPFNRDELRARLRTGRRILTLQDEQLKIREELRLQATHDGLTGTWNRSGILDLLRREYELAARSGSTIGVIMLDLDHFKRVNDTYGHLAGDQVLIEAARRMQQAVRSYDLVGRYGGEEFLIVSPDCDREQIQVCAERIRSVMEEQPILTHGSKIAITVSAGTAILAPRLNTEKEALAAADTALYRAKGAGRNQVVCFEPEIQFHVTNESDPQ